MIPDDDGERDWMEATALAAPALLGAAGGLILGELMHDRARRGVAIGFAAVGVATLVPLAIGGLLNLVNGPESKFGVRRRLRKIRDMGATRSDFDLDDVPLGL